MNESPMVALPTKNPFIARTIDVTGPSGRVYVLHELSGSEQRQADSVSLSPSDAIYYRIGLAIDTIDGERIMRREKKEIVDKLLDAIPGSDTEVLARAYVETFAAHLQGEELKN